MAKPNAYATPYRFGRKSGTCHARHSRTDSVWKTKCFTRGQYVYHFNLSPLQGIETYVCSMLQRSSRMTERHQLPLRYSKVMILGRRLAFDCWRPQSIPSAQMDLLPTILRIQKTGSVSKPFAESCGHHPAEE
jgi:hypothetical protein